jgi:hypothetical protein
MKLFIVIRKGSLQFFCHGYAQVLNWECFAFKVHNVGQIPLDCGVGIEEEDHRFGMIDFCTRGFAKIF